MPELTTSPPVRRSAPLSEGATQSKSGPTCEWHLRRPLPPAASWPALLLAFLLPVSANLSAAPASLPGDAAHGERLAQLCLPCHGSSAVIIGDPPVHPPKLIGQRSEFIYLSLLKYQSGARQDAIMGPVAATLTLQDMRDLGVFLAAGGPVRPPEPAGADSWAHEKVHRDCSACHGETGMGEMWGIPVLTGQNRDYLLTALRRFQQGSRAESTMGPIARQLTPSQAEQLADYFARQTHLKVTP